MEKTTKQALIIAGIGVASYGAITWYKAKKVKETVADTTESVSGALDSLSNLGDTLGDLWETFTGGSDQSADETNEAVKPTTWYDWVDNIFS